MPAPAGRIEAAWIVHQEFYVLVATDKFRELT